MPLRPRLGRPHGLEAGPAELLPAAVVQDHAAPDDHAVTVGTDADDAASGAGDVGDDMHGAGGASHHCRPRPARPAPGCPAPPTAAPRPCTAPACPALLWPAPASGPWCWRAR